MLIRVKRIVEPPEAADGQRVLVDSVWPRGVSRERARLTLWLKEAAPSPALREWFGHDSKRMALFSERYREELSRDPEKARAVHALLDMARRGPITLLYGARDEKVNHARVLQAYLNARAAITPSLQ